jgi:transposase-like protein
LEETLTLHRIECPAALRKVLASTNAIENVMGTIRRVTKRVRRWRNSGMVMRWVCTGLIQAESGFRRISGYTQMKFLLEKIKAEKERNKAA